MFFFWTEDTPIWVLIVFAIIALLGLIASIINKTVSSREENYWDGHYYGEPQTNYENPQTIQLQFTNFMLFFIAAVIKSDKKQIHEYELNYLEMNWENCVGGELFEALPRLNNMLEKDVQVDIVAIAEKSESYFNTDVALEFLFGLAGAIDGTASAAKLEVLHSIIEGWEYTEYDFETLKMLYFSRQGNYNNRENTYSFSNHQSMSDLEKGYKMLGITKAATNDEIKEAYRNQAVKLHPDKVSHMGEQIIEAAHKAFTELNNAYELIKKERGMN